MTRPNLRACLFATAATAFGAAAPALAATPAPAAPVSVQEVVVTATKRAENVQDVPISVAVVSQEALQSKGLTNTSDLNRLVPGLQFSPANTPANDVFLIRGVGTQALGAGLEQSVGVSLDGVPLGRELGAVDDLVDVDHIEVLKGPQGTLFGKNASAGAISIVTVSPRLKTTEVIGRAAYGRLNDQQYSGTINVPVGDDAALRATAWRFKRDGFVHEVNTGQDMSDKNSWGGRLKFRWSPSDALDVNLSGQWTAHDQNGNGNTIRQFEPANFNPFNFGAQIEAFELSHGTVPSPTNYTARGVVTPYYDRGSTSDYTAQVDYHLGGGTVTGLASYRTIKNDNPFDPYPTDNPFNQQTLNQDTEHYNQATGELRYTSPGDRRLRYVAGLFYFKMNLWELFKVKLSGSVPVPVGVSVAMNFDNTNYAAFGEATYDITDQLSVIAGLRGTHDKLTGTLDREFLQPTIVIPGFNGPGNIFGIFQKATTTDKTNVSWRLGLQYKLQPDVMVYATASTGYKGPGLDFNLISNTVSVGPGFDNGVVKPEIGTAFEAGLKSQWLDKRVTLNLAIFHETFKNFQTGVALPGPGLAFSIQNAKELQSDGADAELAWALTPALSVAAAVNYNHARFTDYKNAACYNGQTSATGCINGQQDLSGFPVGNSPKLTTNFSAHYDRPISSTLNVFVEANDAYRTSVVYNADADPHSRQGGYNLINATAGVRTIDGRWRLSVYGNNLGNAHFVDRILPNANGAFYENTVSYDTLRTYGVALDVHF